MDRMRRLADGIESQEATKATKDVGNPEEEPNEVTMSGRRLRREEAGSLDSEASRAPDRGVFLKKGDQVLQIRFDRSEAAID
uniref:Uncharacterized protein n=1 Tax=Melanopsichium pennsylvanicum 4 TaxID=1398559 RepID=A0A077R8T1_9BASI|nr:uncharacterized protein BN887_06214 [Melanopsichium pennsylvanicum 4]